MAHRSIEVLARLADTYSVPLTFNREIEPLVSPIEASLIDVVNAIHERSVLAGTAEREGGVATVAPQGRPATTEDLRQAREVGPGARSTSAPGTRTR